MALEPWCAAPNAILPYIPAIQASLRPPGSSGSHGPFKNVLLSLLARVRRVWVRVRARVMRTMAMRTMMVLQVSALHYSARDWVLGGFWTVASAHALCQPTSCGSKYFYNQRPRVRNLIGTECSLNRGECRVKRKAS